jgi:hypothetical protein
MRRTKKLLLVSVGCTGIVMALLLTAVLATHLLANRDRVKSFIVAKTAQATGGTLDYGNLEVSFLPLPHLEAHDIHLSRPDTFAVSAQRLSVYPGLLPILRGQLSIRRLALAAPDIRIFMDSEPLKAPGSPAVKGNPPFGDGIGTAIGGLFGALGAIDPGTDLSIEDGMVTLAFSDAPDLRIGAIQGAVENDGGQLSLALRCRSDLTGNVDLRAGADMAAMQARGQISLTGINVRPLLFHAALPGGITAGDTRATARGTFTVEGTDRLSGQFDLRFPSLSVMRKDRSLTLKNAATTGSIDYSAKGLSVSVDALRSGEPALDISAAVSIKPADDADRAVVELRAGARQLDVATAAAVTRAIAGDLDDIRTAFSVAREGALTNASYFAGFETGRDGWQLTTMRASGHLAGGLVTIPGIEADLEEMDGEVLYEDQHVAFKNVRGYFKGATVKEMTAAIDWEKESTLSISTPSVAVDIAPLFTWLTGFKGLEAARKNVETASGTARLNGLEISGPLTEPAKWNFKITGSPETIFLESPRLPFAIKLSGGDFTYTPGHEQATGVRIDFLDGFIVSSYQAKGIINEESSVWQIDGTMGQSAIDWLSTVLPIPSHLQMNPPADLSDITIAWSDNRTFSLSGKVKTAGGVEVFSDFTVSPQDWQIRRIQFADGGSRATASARKRPNGMEITFSGNVEKATADRLLENNQTLLGRIEGDFRAEIDTRAPLNSSFAGRLSGEGLRLLRLTTDPIELRHFSIDGSDGRFTIAPSEVSLCNSQLVVDGILERDGGGLTVDLNVDADRLDEDLARILQSVGKDNAAGVEKTGTPAGLSLQGTVQVQAADVTYGGFTWSRVLADVRLNEDNTQIQVNQADLCGISTTGDLAFSPRGVSMQMTPTAGNLSIQETTGCLWNKLVKTDATYSLTGEITLPPTRENPVDFITGQMEFSSENGRIEYASVLMKIFSILNLTEVFTGGKSDLAESGYGYTKAYVKADIRNGKLLLDEILLDGNAMKITGQGSVDLKDRTIDVILLAAPLKTIDRIVNKIPIVGYIMGGSLISVPLGVNGKIDNLSVVPMPPSAVGKGLLGIMERTLEAPFKLVERATDAAPEKSAGQEAAALPPPPREPQAKEANEP